MYTWILSNNNSLNTYLPSRQYFARGGYSFYSDIKIGMESGFFYEGYILSRDNISNKTIDDELVELFEQQKERFIDHIKGIFTLIHFRKDGFKIYSDRFGIKKYFYWLRGDDFIISNDLKAITQNIDVQVSPESMAIYALTYHYTGGRTLFSDVHYIRGAEVLELSSNKLNFSKYWDSGSLLNTTGKKTDDNDIAHSLKQIIKSYLALSKTDNASLSLTAGADSRLLFSILKDQNLRLHTYTYGNPESIDCVIAKRIAEDFEIPHKIHDIRFTKSSFTEKAINSLMEGQSLCSLHRAHRANAIELEASYGDIMFLGTMGGEFIKVARQNDNIISNFVYDFSKNPDKDVLVKHLIKKGVKIEYVNIDNLVGFFRSQDWCRYPELVDLYGLVDIAAGLHHAQNNQLYNKYFKYVFSPFLDIDFLETIFKSKYHFLLKRRHLTKFHRRLENHRYAVNIQNILCPELMQYPYNSGIVAKEYLQNSIYAAIRSRIRKKSWSSTSNFPLDSFISEFTIEQLKLISGSKTIISQLFDINKLLDELNKKTIKTTEGSWLKYTNPVQFKLTLDIFT